jgi:hypothetical protein
MRNIIAAQLIPRYLIRATKPSETFLKLQYIFKVNISFLSYDCGLSLYARGSYSL